MGRIAQAAVMGIVRGIFTKGLVLAYVVGVCFVFFFVPLGRWGEKLNPDPKELVFPLGFGTLLLLVLPALVALLASRWRNARFNSLFTPLGLEGFAFALQYRRYDGTIGGRRFQALFSRGPRIVLEADAAVPTRFGITAGAEDTKLLAGLAGEKPIRFAVPAFDGLAVFSKEEAWVRRLLAEPGVPALLARLLCYDGPLARRQVVLRPGALTLTFQLSTAFLSWIPSPEQARDWAGALVELADVAERVPPPAVPLAPTRLEQQVGSIRGFGLTVNPGVVALGAILATPLLIGAIAGAVILAGRSRTPDYGPGSRAEARDLISSVAAAGQSLQVAEMAASGVLGQLGAGEKAATVEREDASALYASAKAPAGARIVVTKDPATGVAREVEFLLATPPAIRMRDLEQRWGRPSFSPAPDDPSAVVAVFTKAHGEGARWPVRVRVRFQGKAGGPVTRIAAYRESSAAPLAGVSSNGVPPRAATKPTTAGPRAEAPAPVAAASDSAATGLLSACPASFEQAGGMAVGESRSCVCIYGPVGGAVFGSGRYGPGSSVCEAARHAGVVSKPGDAATFWRQPDCPRLWGSEGNGVVSVNKGAPTATYSFTAAPPPCPPPPSAAAELEPCPTGGKNGLDARLEGSSFDCTCTYKKRLGGVVWGKDVYAIFSDVCDSAQHAGAVGPGGSTVTVFLGGPCGRFVRSSRMGIDSDSWSKPARSMAFRLPYPPCPG